MTKHDMYIMGAIGLGLIILYNNRGSFMPKQSLDMNPNDGQRAIRDALRKIKLGQIEVRNMPEEIRKELINAK
jgi:hypothetical protein